MYQKQKTQNKHRIPMYIFVNHIYCNMSKYQPNKYQFQEFILRNYQNILRKWLFH